MEAECFSSKDAKRLCSLLARQKLLVVKKRRWLGSMFPGPDGQSSSMKRPKFLKDVFLAESEVRSDELSCERVKAHVERSYGTGKQHNCHQHHVVQDGAQLFNLPKGMDGSLCSGSLTIMHSTLNKLSNEALYSLAIIVTHNESSFETSRAAMKKILKEHLPKYLNECDNESMKSALSGILTNPCSFVSESVSLTTPITPMLLSSINRALDGLDELPARVLVAMNGKLTDKSSPPRFLLAIPRLVRVRLVNKVRKSCRKIMSKLEEGNDLPNNLAKALSVMILYWKLSLRRVDFSQSEFFAFSRRTMSLHNEILTALWSLENIKRNDLKLLRRILRQGSKVETFFKTAARMYLTDCLFECDEGNLPDEALRAIAFLIQIAPNNEQVVFTEETREAEVEAALAVSSCLKSLVHGDTEASLSDDEMSLESDRCSEDNDFVLTETNYFNLGSQQQRMEEPCCSNVMSNSGDCANIEVSGSSTNSRKCEAAASMMAPKLKEVAGSKNVETARRSKDVSEVFDETAILARNLIGEVLKNLLVSENKDVDEATRCYLGGKSSSQSPQAHSAEENQKDDPVIKAIQTVVPNISKSIMDKVRRILDVDQ